jgi:hypothetical protein
MGGRGHKAIRDTNSFTPQSNTTPYLVARLKRDHPEIPGRDAFTADDQCAGAFRFLRNRRSVNISPVVKVGKVLEAGNFQLLEQTLHRV